MKVYISEEDHEVMNRLQGFDISSYEDADKVLIVPGGLSTFYDLFRGLRDQKDICLYNRDYYFTALLNQLFDLYENKKEDRAPSDYMDIESDLEEIVRIFEEDENDKVNDGETGKLL